MAKAGDNKKTVMLGNIEHVVGTHYTDEEINAVAEEMVEWMQRSDTNLYYVSKLLHKKHIYDQRISEFRKRNKKFAEAYEICRQIKRERMIELGFDKSINTTWLIFVFKNEFGWRDTPEPKDESDEDNSLTFEGWK